MTLSTLATLLLVAFTAANAQCFAACSLFSCTNASGQQEPVSSGRSSSCHHKAPPTDKNQSNSPCGHQIFLSEVGPHVKAFAFEDGMSLAVSLGTANAVQVGTPRVEAAKDHSPPPASLPSFPTILRI